MALTVADLTRIPYLRTRLLAGESGAGNVVTWAHSNEMAAPWEWMEEGNLLMTVGLGIPAEAPAQVRYVRNLARIGVSGLAIGEDMLAPPLSEAMLAAADELALPICLTAYEVPFMEISRVVAASTGGRETARIVGVERVYERARQAIGRNASPEELIGDLEDELDCDLLAIAHGTGVVLLAGTEPPAALVARIAAALGPRDVHRPALWRPALGTDREALVVAIPARRACSLVALPRGETTPPFILMQHVATLAALEIERRFATREERRRLGSQLFAQLLDGRVSPGAAHTQLTALRFTDRPLRVIAGEARDGEAGDVALSQRLEDTGVPYLELRREELTYLLIHDPADGERLPVDLLDDEDRIGVSTPFTDLGLVRSAAREASWALHAGSGPGGGGGPDGAGGMGGHGYVYGDDAPLLGPRTIGEARAVVERILGPVLRYDAAHDGQLVASLAAFLDHNRSWQRTAGALGVHKQTLVYRIRRVEELTGRRLSVTGECSELWQAVAAHRSLHNVP